MIWSSTPSKYRPRLPTGWVGRQEASTASLVITQLLGAEVSVFLSATALQ